MQSPLRRHIKVVLPAAIETLATQVVDSAYRVHKELGPGLLESVYERCMEYELRKRGIPLETQICLPIKYGELVINDALRLDMLVGGKVVVENKALDAILPVHKAQILTYLKLTKCRLGLLINFNVPLIKEGIQRIIL